MLEAIEACERSQEAEFVDRTWRRTGQDTIYPCSLARSLGFGKPHAGRYVSLIDIRKPWGSRKGG